MQCRSRWSRRTLRLEPLEPRVLLSADALLAHWTLDDVDVSGDTIADVAAAPEGPLDGMKTNGGPATGVAGVVGQAAQFAGGANNGDHHFVDLATHAATLESLGEGTLAAWIRPDTSGLTTNVLTIFAASDATAGSVEARWFISNDAPTQPPFYHGRLVYGVRGSTADGEVISGVDLLDGAWHHVAMSVNGANAVSMYVDGQPAASGTAAFLDGLSALNSASLGRNKDSAAGGGQWFYDGLMDDVGLWRDVLTPAEVKALVALAQNGTLNYDLGQSQQLFNVHDNASGSAQIDGLAWSYVASGLPGGEGELVVEGVDAFSINLGGGAGVRTGAPPLFVTATDPPDGAFLANPPTTMTVEFSEPVDPLTLDADDLAVGGIDATGVAVVDGDTVVFDLPGGIPPGTSNVVIDAGAIASLDGALIESYTGQFTLPDAPSIVTLPVGDIGANLATLRGEITDNGGQDPDVTVFWGTVDAGVDAGLWQHSVVLGTQGSGVFETQVTGLDPLETYFYRVFASNTGGDVWASASESFATVDYPPLLITEFLADNDDGLVDQDGDNSDWIEVYNPGLATVDLIGWHLTDDPFVLTKWQFPSHVLAPDQFVVVFASEEDRAVSGFELHTNFRLNDAGDYLALVEPDGVTIASEYGSATTDYPQQYSDVSYGVEQRTTTITLAPTDADAKFLVPTDASLETTWNDPATATDTWTDVVMPIGFDATPTDPALLAYWDFDTDAAPGGTVADVSGHPGGHDGTLVGDAVASGGELVLDGSGDYVDVGDQPALEGLSAMTVAAWVFSDVAFTDLRRIVEHEDVFYFWSQGGTFRFTVHGSSTQISSGTTLSAGTWYHVAATTNGATAQLYVNGALDGTAGMSAMPTSAFPLQIGARRSSGGAASNFWDGMFDDVAIWDRVLSTDEIAELAGGTRPSQIGDTSAAFQTDVQPAMHNVNASAYTRIPFTLPGDPAELDHLTLNVAYDDGVVAYLNGQEVARRGVTGPVAWNTAADADLQSPGVESIDLTEHLDKLTTGDNLLAIQSLNAAAGNADLLTSAELIALDVEPLDTAELRYFPTPTPGELNGEGTLGIVTEQAAFSHAGGTFVDPFDLVLSTDVVGAAIHFTLDGSIPDATSPVYTDPITIDSTVEVRTRLIVPDLAPGPLFGQTFIHLAADVAAFDSPLPIVVVENFGAGAIPNKRAAGQPGGDGSGIVQVARQPAALAIFDRDVDRAALTGQADLNTRIGIRVRGTSSANFTKKSYSVETWEHADNDQSVAVLDMPAESDWVLYAPTADFDLPLIHNSFIYELSNQTGNYAVRTRFVEAFVNIDGGSLSMADHAGLYILMEKIKRDGDRVDFDPLSDDGTQGGWMITSDRMDPIPIGGVGTPQHFHTAGPNRIPEMPPNQPGDLGDDIPVSYNTFFNFDSPGGYDINPVQRQSIEDWFEQFEDALYGPNYTDPLLGYAAYLDVDSLIDHFILNNLPKNRDGLQLSTWMYKESPEEKLKFGPIWDFDRAFTRSLINGGSPTADLDWGRQFLWMPRLFTDVDFEQRYIDRWQELRLGPLSMDNMTAIIDAQAAEITQEVVTRNGTANWTGELDAMEAWLAARTAALDAQFTPPVEFDAPGGVVAPGFELGLTAPQGTIYYTLDGTDPRLPGGGVAPGAIEVTGIGGATTLVGPAAAAAAVVPDATFDATFGTTWNGLPVNEPFVPLAGDGWEFGTTGVGYDENPDYLPLIGLDVGEMNDVNASVYVRIEFTIDGAVPTFDFLTLKMKYDDGFVAYINGVPVADMNAPASPAWNSLSTAQQDDNAAIVFETFDISAHLPLLQSGTNVLAIHGLNREIDSSDLLLVPELTAGTLVDAAVTINENANVVARALDGADWSGPTQDIFLIDLAQQLVVTEVNYNPHDPTAAELAADPTLDNDRFEFVELQNVGTATLDLTGVHFTDGVDFDFTGGAVTSLAPGEFVLVVRDQTAFELRYGPGLPVAGEFANDTGLRNSGERVELSDASAIPIQAFTYNDSSAWPQGADGDGRSLEVVNVTSDYDQPATWHDSVQIGGSPGLAATPLVLARHVFYDNSAFDTVSDDDAIAPDKTALLPGQPVSFANVTSFADGMAGVIVDLAHSIDAAAIDGGDFHFHVGNSADPGAWSPVATLPIVTVRPGEGRGGSDRAALTWPAGTLTNTWLQVTVRSDSARVGVPDDDVFYFGNAVGETGNSSTNALVTAADVIAIRDNPRGLGNRADVSSVHDIDRDRLVNATDAILARNHATGPFDALRLITPPLPLPPPAEAEAEPRRVGARTYLFPRPQEHQAAPSNANDRIPKPIPAPTAATTPALLESLAHWRRLW